MKTVMVMFDSLNRHLLPAYGCDWTHAPNFRRLAVRAATFDSSYVCSMPCMPARRDLHTGRPNFLHTGWGQLEPFDDSFVEMLGKAGVHTHLVSDHYHYWEEAGATYHTRYDSWEFCRGQEGDPFIGQVAPPDVPANINGKGKDSDWVNRRHIREDADYPQTQTFRQGIDFIERNRAEDNWFLQIECFDPHEPFTCHRQYRDLYPPANDPDVLFDWPGYRPVRETAEQVEDCRHNYAALLSKCDASLGDILDAFDRHNLWEDTMLVVWTDHGFLLGEHDCWAKNWPPLYEEVAHTPFFVHDPRHAEADGQRRRALVQPSIDLAPTLLRFHGLEPTADMLGHDLGPVLANDSPVREAAIFGYHGKPINITDGRYVHMRAVVDDSAPSHRYTLAPRTVWGSSELEIVGLAGPFSFTKGEPVLQLRNPRAAGQGEHFLFDLQTDPQQDSPIEDADVEASLCDHMARLMRACSAPPELYPRMGLTLPPDESTI